MKLSNETLILKMQPIVLEENEFGYKEKLLQIAPKSASEGTNEGKVYGKTSIE